MQIRRASVYKQRARLPITGSWVKRNRRQAGRQDGKSSGSVLDCQSLGLEFKEAGGRQVSLVVTYLDCESSGLRFKEAGLRLVITVVACWTVIHWALGSN